MKKHTGIILKNYIPKKHKLSMVDKELGKVEVLINDVSLFSKLCHGAVIHYYPVPYGTLYKISEIEIIAVPFGCARENIFFLHHVLELCYHFFPQGYVDKNFFETLLFLIESEGLVQNQHKLLFLFRIMIMVGGVSELKEQDYAQVSMLAMCPLEELLNTVVSERECVIVRQIIFDCIARHPYVAGFKTLAFLTESGIL